MHVEVHPVSITTDGSGDATAYTPHVTGRLLQCQYVKTDFADGVDFTITGEQSGRTLWTETNVNASALRMPRSPTHDSAGVASLYAGSGEPVEDAIPLANERIKVVVANGGATKTGLFRFWIG